LSTLRALSSFGHAITIYITGRGYVAFSKTSILLSRKHKKCLGGTTSLASIATVLFQTNLYALPEAIYRLRRYKI